MDCSWLKSSVSVDRQYQI